MKAELSSIRQQLESLGPTRRVKNDWIREDNPKRNIKEDMDLLSSGSSSQHILQSTHQESDVKDEDGAKATATGVPVYHINTNRFPQVGAKNKINGLPTLVLYFEGTELWRNEGIMTGEDIVTVLRRLKEEGWAAGAAVSHGDTAGDTCISCPTDRIDLG